MAESTQSSTVVDAPPSAVLEVVADFPAYPEWAGSVREVEVLSTGASGRAERVRFVLDAGALKDAYVLAYDWRVAPDGQGAVSWSLVEAERVLTALDGSYSFTAVDGGSTRVDYALAVDVRIPMLGMLKRKAEKAIITTALTELKKRVEG